MKVKVKNLGVLKQAELTLGDLTIICGGHTTGKTYATYSGNRCIIISLGLQEIPTTTTHQVWLCKANF
ncbi:hypothetical protein QUA40_17960 [Microcoleus sp. Pol11C3]|uniref:hypothetical protein n=1 Tax=Microcoleus sp. Pol11C3 TaxID=3055390 RepID=UPI002FD1E7C3